MRKKEKLSKERGLELKQNFLFFLMEKQFLKIPPGLFFVKPQKRENLHSRSKGCLWSFLPLQLLFVTYLTFCSPLCCITVSPVLDFCVTVPFFPTFALLWFPTLYYITYVSFDLCIASPFFLSLCYSSLLS